MTPTKEQIAAWRNLGAAYVEHMPDGEALFTALCDMAEAHRRSLEAGPSASGRIEVIPVAEIERQIDHIQRNGVAVAKFGGKEIDEGRCRELCAMYLREFIQTERMGKRLLELYPERQSPPMEKAASRKHAANIRGHVIWLREKYPHLDVIATDLLAAADALVGGSGRNGGAS